MRFAIFSSMGNTTWNDVATLWRHSEETGWDAACVTDPDSTTARNASSNRISISA